MSFLIFMLITSLGCLQFKIFYKTRALNEILKSFLGSGHGHCWRFFNRSIRGWLIGWGRPAQSRRSNGGQQRWFKWLINDDRAKCIAQCRSAKIVWPVKQWGSQFIHPRWRKRGHERTKWLHGHDLSSGRATRWWPVGCQHKHERARRFHGHELSGR